MNKADILELINAGENSRIEFKSTLFDSDSLAKEVVAFSNMKGGDIYIYIYIGITDDGEIENIDSTKEEKIVNICRNNIHPSIIPEIITIIVDGKKILKVLIEKGLNKPYKVKYQINFM